MIDFRIIMSEHDESLEGKIKQTIEPFCESVDIIEEGGDGGTVLTILAIVLAVPEFIINMKIIISWINEKIKKLKQNKEAANSDNKAEAKEDTDHEISFTWKIEIDGKLLDLQGLSSQDQQFQILEAALNKCNKNG